MATQGSRAEAAVFVEGVDPHAHRPLLWHLYRVLGGRRVLTDDDAEQWIYVFPGMYDAARAAVWLQEWDPPARVTEVSAWDDKELPREKDTAPAPGAPPSLSRWRDMQEMAGRAYRIDEMWERERKRARPDRGEEVDELYEEDDECYKRAEEKEPEVRRSARIRKKRRRH